MRITISLFLWTLIMVYGLLPLEFEALWRKDQAGDLIITGQGCGCPCPNAIVLQGELDIPEKILHEHPNMYKRQVTLVGNTPFEPFVFEVAISRLLIQGEVIGVDTVLCSRSGCEFAPEFRVDDWTLLSYQARYVAWGENIQRGYRVLFYLGLVFLFLGAMRRFTTLSMWMRVFRV